MGLKKNKAKQAQTNSKPQVMTVVKETEPEEIVESFLPDDEGTDLAEDEGSSIPGSGAPGEVEATEKGPAKPARDKIMTLLNKEGDRLARVIKSVGHYTDEIGAKLAAVMKGLEDTYQLAYALPADFVAPRRSGGGRKPLVLIDVAVGDLISVKENYRDLYAAEGEDTIPVRLKALALQKDAKGNVTKVKVDCGDGTKTFVERKHLIRFVET